MRFHSAEDPRPDPDGPRESRGGPGRRRAVRHRAKPHWTRRRLTWVLGGGAAVVLLLWLLVGGLAMSALTIQKQAGVAQAELDAFRATLELGDEVAAGKHLTAAEQALAKARDAAADDDVRDAAGWPWVGNTINDLDHLLRAATILTRSGRDALTVYTSFTGADSKLFSNGSFDLGAVGQAQDAVDRMTAAMIRAERQLLMVRGEGPAGGTVMAKQRTGLRQMRELRRELVALQPLLEAMPRALGAKDPRTYLVAIMNPSELRASGGAPLSVAFLRFDEGKMSIPLKGATAELTGSAKMGPNREFVWDRLTGRRDPWALPKGEAERFVNTTFNPDFTVSGEQMVRATPKNFGFKTDGVIAVDLLAVGELLRATGPIESARYGTITADNIAQKLLIEAYEGGNDDASVALRREANAELMSVMLTRLTEGGGLIGKVRALGQAAPGRHLQMYFRDPALQKAVADRGLAGDIPDPETGNLTAVYTQNGNGNKLDVYQQRTVREQVRLRGDGSAVVRRTVELSNPSPPYTAPFPDRLRGYDTRYATNLVINLMPRGARVLEDPVVEMPETVDRGRDQVGRTYAQAAVMLEPQGSAALTWTYVVPRAAVREGNTWVLVNAIAPQAMLNPATLDLSVQGPEGYRPLAKKGWKRADGTARITTPMDATTVLTLRFAPKGEPAETDEF